MVEKAPERLRRQVLLGEAAKQALEGTKWDVRFSAMATFIHPLVQLGPSVMVSEINATTFTAVLSCERKDLLAVLHYFQNGEDHGTIRELPEEDVAQSIPAKFLFVASGGKTMQTSEPPAYFSHG